MYALRIVGNPYESEDIVQESFISIWNRIQTSESDPDNFKSYVYRTVRNNALIHIRQKSSVEPLDEKYADIPDDEAIDTSERDANIWRSIDELPSKRRTILLLNKRDGMSYDEIAAHLGISKKTVENQLGKAYKTIREAGRRFYLLLFA